MYNDNISPVLTEHVLYIYIYVYKIPLFLFFGPTARNVAGPLLSNFGNVARPLL